MPKLKELSLGDGTNGAGTGAGTAINAGTLVDLANAVGILDGTDRADTHAGTAADAGIANFESHSIVPPDRIFAIRPLQPHAVLGMANYRPVPQPVHGYYSILSQKIKRFAKAWCRPPQKTEKGQSRRTPAGQAAPEGGGFGGGAAGSGCAGAPCGRLSPCRNSVL